MCRTRSEGVAESNEKLCLLGIRKAGCWQGCYTMFTVRILMRVSAYAGLFCCTLHSGELTLRMSGTVSFNVSHVQRSSTCIMTRF